MRFAGQAVAHVAGSACQGTQRRGSGPCKFQYLSELREGTGQPRAMSIVSHFSL